MANILVVEDDPSIATVLEEILTGRDYEVRVAHNPSEAFDAIQARVPELLLMDVNLGADIDGIETVQRLRAGHEDLPVCFITAQSDDETVRRAEQVEPMAYLVKPFEMADVLTMVNISLASARRMRERIEKLTARSASTDNAVVAAAGDAPIDQLEDKATGLPNRQYVERVVAGWGVECDNFLAVLSVDHIGLLRNRFGGSAVEQVLFSFSQHLGQQLPEFCSLARWDFSTFVVVPQQFDPGAQREIARLVAAPMLYHLRLPGRSALLRVSATMRLLRPGDRPIADQIQSG